MISPTNCTTRTDITCKAVWNGTQ